MAYNFDSGQFNDVTSPRRLGNWEVPRWSPTKARDLQYRPDPKPICDINGHFLPGAPRGTSRCFGHYTGTWELPRKITRKVAEQLQKEPPPGRFPDWLNLRVQRPHALAQQQKSARLRAAQRGQPPKEEEPEEVDEQSFKPHLWLFERKEPVDAQGNSPYIPGSLTEPDKRHDSYDLLVKDAVEKIHGPQEPEEDKFWRKVAENAKKNEKAREEAMRYEKSRPLKLPQVNVAQNFQFAKKMHVGNLEHQPLPDTLGYRNLTKIAEHRDSDIVVKPYAIGWKGYGASGPTCCTKLRVHRPKTSDQSKPEGEKGGLRPATSAPDLGGQYKKPLSLMDLAICWDFRPPDHRQEPKPPKHIDGSNGSKAPAVFTMVHTPKEPAEEFVHSHAQPIFNQNRVPEDVIGHHVVPYFEKDMTKDKRKDSCDVQYCPQHNGGSRNGSSRKSSAQSLPKPNGNGKCDGIHGCGTPSETSRKSSREEKRPEKLAPVKQAWNGNTDNKNYDINRNRHSLESYEKTPLAQGKLNQSSPKDSQGSRNSTKDSETTANTKHKTCFSCNGTKVQPEQRNKEEYKSAFKAGNPNSVQSNSCSTDSKGVKIPKMRHPYTKKNYSIPTLAPPFSIWRDANATGYPEHWRLASVYQHAYKPPEQRRKPLISSVYQ
ncbi:hypothetical protein NE865_01816 [Phthorimaea operculella]|nr:hypothetical protein NE865_01816 [Phthorimaea operculella]